MPNALKGEEAFVRPGRRWSLRSFLVVAQISLSLILLCAASDPAVATTRPAM